MDMGKNNPYNELCSIFRLQHTSLGSEERLFLEHFQGLTFCVLWSSQKPSVSAHARQNLPSQTCSAALSSCYRIHPTCSVGNKARRARLPLCCPATPQLQVQNRKMLQRTILLCMELQTSKHSTSSITAHINQGMQLLTGHWSITIGRQQRVETFQYVFLHSFSWNRRSRLNKPLLELVMHIFQGMGITACKGDFEAYKLEWISLGANQEKKGIFT